ncbi:MAG: M20/M25/M40 family metallo-hydrolase [Betaproteobacteria bacterium]|nr:M20/M25/M40 family metallo-hydrolase [Betaproteobacteria bacterium]
MTIRKAIAPALLVCTALVSTLPAAAETLAPHQQLARDIYKELVEINTVTFHGDTLKAANAMAARLKVAGFPDADVKVLSPAPKKGNLVARYRGTGAGTKMRKPILLVAHLDVVEALKSDWSTDPFQLVEKDGYFYARGSGDDKFMAAVWVANLIRYKQEGFKPDRDIILVLETDEEILDANNVGMHWLVTHHRDLIDAEYALNEGAGVGTKNGKALRNGVQTSEKVFQNYRLEVKNVGGHSSMPSKDNAIYHLAQGLSRLAQFDFPFSLNETTRAFFARSSAQEEGQLGADMKAITLDKPDPAAIARMSALPGYNNLMRTTCVATMLEGGHATNALPQTARANVNCRILPGEPVEEIRKTLVRVVADEQIAVTFAGASVLSEPSPLNPEIMQAIEKLSNEFWPGIAVIPTMSAGGTDGVYLRNIGIPTYGHSGRANDIGENRAHGKDERIIVKSFYEGGEYLYRLVKMLSSPAK